MPEIDVNDTTLYYERSGHGPGVLFVHGMCGHADVWADQAERFSDRYTCVRHDRRGHSRSARGDAPITTTQHANDAAAIIEALDLAPCQVVGSSSGAVIAVDLALRYGGLLRGVVLSEPPLFSLDPEAGRAAMSELMPRIDDAIASGGIRAAVDAFMSFACSEAWSMLDEDRKDRLRDNAEIGFTDLQSPPLDVGPADLAAIRVPALVVAGTTSVPGLRSVARRLAAALPDARFVEIAGGHVPYLENPETFAHAVSVFAAELDRRAPVPSS
ncbi:MAG: alpha/beta fold hydrolase [Acidimicrobiales bacterium]